MEWGAITKCIVEWYQQNKRILPWREEKNPWHWRIYSRSGCFYLFWRKSTCSRWKCSLLQNKNVTSYIVPEPYGVTVIMAPWNYPFMLSIDPLIASISAGNCCILKPSEYAPNTSHRLAKLLQECFSEEYVSVVEGGIEESSKLLEQEVDYIFFTGGTKIGQIVMEHAAKKLIPVTLELGGKSPCIIEDFVISLT